MTFGKILFITGLLLAGLGLLIHFGGKIPFLGRLPGDIRIESERVTFYFPLATCLLLSAIISLIIWLFRR
ncbi:MAG: DUF2905 domain-containing protein [Syntrophotaleaceae bacterium]